MECTVACLAPTVMRFVALLIVALCCGGLGCVALCYIELYYLGLICVVLCGFPDAGVLDARIRG